MLVFVVACVVISAVSAHDLICHFVAVESYRQRSGQILVQSKLLEVCDIVVKSAAIC